jgi:hypothetical protein
MQLTTPLHTVPRLRINAGTKIVRDGILIRKVELSYMHSYKDV